MPKNKLLIMKISVLLCFFFVFNVSAKSWSQNLVNITQKNISIAEVFEQIKKQTGLQIVYSNAELDDSKKVDVDFVGQEVEKAIEILLKGTKLEVKREGNYLLIHPKDKEKKTENAKQEDQVIRGQVVDDKGLPVPGVNVILLDNNTGTTTNIDGYYTLKVPGGEGTLAFSFIGFQTQKVEVSSRLIINIQLVLEVSEIEDVVVTGYFEKRKDSYTGSARTFSGEALRNISTHNVLSTLSIVDPGFTMIDNVDAGSDPNHIPEFVIQGQSSLESEFGNVPNMPTFILDGFEVQAQKIFDLDPNRIKSMTILKDAAATAIYGSRAANGVVVVETIAPQPGELKLNYTGAIDVSVADLSYYNLMNAEEKLEYELLAGLYSSSNIYYQDDLLDQYNERKKLVGQGYNTDWISIPLHDVGLSQKHSVFIEGGDDNFRYGVNFTYKGVDGVMRGSSNDQLGTGIKLLYRMKNLNVRNHISYKNVNRKNSPFGAFSQYTYLNPYYYPYNENGTYNKVLHDFESNQIPDVYNPLYNTTLNLRDDQHYSDFTDNFSLDWKVSKGFRVKANLSISQIKSQTDNFKPADHTSFVHAELKGRYVKEVSEELTFDGNLVVSYLKSFKKHLLNMVVVGNVKETVSDGFSIAVYNFPNDNLDHIGSGLQYLDGARPKGYNNINRLAGFVDNFNYSYDNKYLVDLSVRTDGSSIYGADRRWGTFGSLGIGWNLHNEDIIKNIKEINKLKIRASLGNTGSNNFNPYQAMMMYSYRDPAISGLTYGGYLGALLKAYGNKDLQWQTTNKSNIGFDFSLFDSRLSGLFNVYRNVSEGVLINVLLAPSTGFNSYKGNLGKVENQGFDFNIRSVLIKSNNFQWDLFGAVTQNNNRLLELNDALIAFNEKQDEATQATNNQKPVVRYSEGQSISTIWANESLGIDPNTGQEVFKDINNKKTNVWSTDNYKPLGNGDPKFLGNFGTTLRYKGWQLDSYFMYRFKEDIYNKTLVDKIENVNPRNNADKRVLYDRWKEPGDFASFKAIANQQVTLPTSRFIESQSYIQLKSLNISYFIPKKILDNYGIERCKLSFIGNDIFRWSTVKVERGIAYPFARNYSFSVQLTF